MNKKDKRRARTIVLLLSLMLLISQISHSFVSASLLFLKIKLKTTSPKPVPKMTVPWVVTGGATVIEYAVKYLSNGNYRIFGDSAYEIWCDI